MVGDSILQSLTRSQLILLVVGYLRFVSLRRGRPSFNVEVGGFVLSIWSFEIYSCIIRGT